MYLWKCCLCHEHNSDLVKTQPTKQAVLGFFGLSFRPVHTTLLSISAHQQSQIFHSILKLFEYCITLFQCIYCMENNVEPWNEKQNFFFPVKINRITYWTEQMTPNLHMLFSLHGTARQHRSKFYCQQTGYTSWLFKGLHQWNRICNSSSRSTI